MKDKSTKLIFLYLYALLLKSPLHSQADLTQAAEKSSMHVVQITIPFVSRMHGHRYGEEIPGRQGQSPKPIFGAAKHIVPTLNTRSSVIELTISIVLLCVCSQYARLSKVQSSEHSLSCPSPNSVSHVPSLLNFLPKYIHFFHYQDVYF